MARLLAAIFCLSAALLLYELTLTRVFAVVLFSDLAHLALSVAMLGMGVGALVQHLWPVLHADSLRTGVFRLTVAQGLATVLAIGCAVSFPLVHDGQGLSLAWQPRAAQRFSLLNWGWFALLVPILSIPPLFAGISVAGVFEHRSKRLGVLYGADLIGAGLAVAVFIPAIAALQGPDTVWFIVLLCMTAALSVAPSTGARLVSGGGVLMCLALLGVTLGGEAVMTIRTPAAWSTVQVLETRWTGLTRITVFDEGSHETVLLDNATLSNVVVDPVQLAPMLAMPNRGLVYQLGVPRGVVAILASSAGPDVVTARHFGYENIDAIDVEGQIFELVAERYDSPLNPYRAPGVRQIVSDARSALMRAEPERYHIIQLVNANLFGANGLLANAWSPSLLTTKEAFHLYLDRLAPDGVLSLTNLAQTRWAPRNAAAALRERGVEEPYRHIAFIGGSNQVFLLRPRPWTARERAALVSAMRNYPTFPIVLDPLLPKKDPEEVLRQLPVSTATRSRRALAPMPPVQTDDHPYLDSPRRMVDALRTNTFPEGMMYRTLLTQGAIAALAGGVVIGLPVLLRGRRELRGEGAVIGYAACLGGGYLAVELVLLYHLTLFVGHPSYAISAVVFSMLIFSGVGSVLSSRGPRHQVAVRLRRALTAVILLGLVQAFVIPELLVNALIAAPLWVRLIATGLSLAPLSVAMGMCFPYGMRLVRPRMVPWAWAVNGWMSVVGGFLTVLVTRTLGYSWAMVLALTAYLVAATLVGRLDRS